jgi:BASS family bile acid:Na+ symporter
VAEDFKQHMGGRFAWFVHRYFLWLLVACYAVAAIWPAPGAPLRQWTWSPGGLPQMQLTVPLLLLALMLFSAALLTDLGQIRAVLQRPLLLFIATVAVWLAPALLVVLAGYIVPLLTSEQDATGVLVGLTLVATMPVANSSTGWTQNTAGNLALSLALVVLSISLSPLVTPQLLNALGMALTASERAYCEALVNRFSGEFFIIWVIIPTLAGFACRRLMSPTRVERVRSRFILASAVALLVLNYINAAIALPYLSDSGALVIAITAALALAVCTVGLVAGWLIARMLRLPHEMRTSLFYSLSMKHTGLALVLAASVLANQPVAILMIVLATLMQHLCAALVQWLLQHWVAAGRRSAVADLPSSAK